MSGFFEEIRRYSRVDSSRESNEDFHKFKINYFLYCKESYNEGNSFFCLIMKLKNFSEPWKEISWGGNVLSLFPKKVTEIVEGPQKYSKFQSLRTTNYRAKQKHYCDQCEHIIFPWDIYEKRIVAFKWNIFEFKVHVFPWCEYDPDDGSKIEDSLFYGHKQAA